MVDHDEKEIYSIQSKKKYKQRFQSASLSLEYIKNNFVTLATLSVKEHVNPSSNLGQGWLTLTLH